MIKLDDIKNNPVIDSFVRKGDEYLSVLGYTEHSYRHTNHVSTIAYNILKELEYPERTAELASIAGYLHDIGNVLNRTEHGLSGACLCVDILINMGMRPDEVATVISAIANHEEEYGHPINDVAAALIMADKSDVHRSRVRNPDFETFDIHDRVNYAVEYAFLRVSQKTRTITMDITIDNSICSIMEYFEIFFLKRLNEIRSIMEAIFLKFAMPPLQHR
ncbi:MAG: Metal dependent phosphohydrolase [Desulfotomaculum sp. 46_296]|nr:MAG: Metal dependent phosphohydrolase [Desulfotomaculum sp. 46_296]